MSEGMDELSHLLDVPFFFWVCPKGCRGRVTWHHAEDGTATAECLACGERSGIFAARGKT